MAADPSTAVARPRSRVVPGLVAASSFGLAGVALGVTTATGFAALLPTVLLLACAGALGLVGAVAGARAVRSDASGALAAAPLPVAASEPEDPFNARVRAICTTLRQKGQGPLAESLQKGLEEAEALSSFRSRIGDIPAMIAESRRDAGALRTRAAASKDNEARETWLAAAKTANDRVASLEAMITEEERANARIQAFRQLVKSLETDIGRLAHGDADDALAQLAEHRGRMTREVEAMRRTRQELRRLQQAQ
jgi:hypothetical protein